MVDPEGRDTSVLFLGGPEGTEGLKLSLVPWGSANRKGIGKKEEKLTV